MSEFLFDEGSNAANQTLADRARFELSPEKWAGISDGSGPAHQRQARAELNRPEIELTLN